MTYIRDLDDVRPDRRRREAETRPAAQKLGLKLGLCAAIALTVLTGLNVWASARLYKSSNELAVVQQRLEQLSLFEKRISDKIDLVNNGLQGQFDRLTTTVASRVDGAADQMGQVETALGAVKQSIDDRQLEVSAIAPAVDAPQKGPRVIRRTPSKALVSQDAAAPRVSAAFVRVQGADGKLTYKKIR